MNTIYEGNGSYRYPVRFPDRTIFFFSYVYIMQRTASFSCIFFLLRKTRPKKLFPFVIAFFACVSLQNFSLIFRRRHVL